MPALKPVTAPAPARTAEPPSLPLPPPAPATGPAARLLLVDDSAVARVKLRKLFEGAGYQVALAKDGLDALEQLGTVPAGHFALMITDLEMPRMTGLELVQAIAVRGDLQAMHILAISGHDDLQAQLSACPGVRGVFKKPWHDEDLLAQVDALACPGLVRPLQL